MAHFFGGNQIKLLRNGAEYFPALEAAIENAAISIYLQTYIYEADETGKRIGNALKRAVQRGVAVNVLLDGFGCKDLPKTYIQELKQAGVQVILFRPKISPWTLKKNRLRRLHRKVAVIDETIAFVGGINIIDDTNVPHQTAPRIDYAVRLEGPILVAIVASVYKLWRRLNWVNTGHANWTVDKIHAHKPPQTAHSGLRAALVVRDNILHRRDIEQAYLTAISHAKSEIIIANAYFLPSRKFRKALIASAQRGVTVKLLLQGRKEYFLMFATHAFYNEFLNNGIEIYEYQKSFMHSKIAVVDSKWATVGSSNMDPFSLLLAYEANVVVEDTTFAKELRTEIMTSIEEGASSVTSNGWKQESKVKYFFSWIAYGLVRVFLGVIGHSND
ncbi:MAG TPA: cardiolipin synthase ClsB [Methylotenera sp.]|nr:cardiolipin synthase ClsB [Methylotenera sp.]